MKVVLNFKNNKALECYYHWLRKNLLVKSFYKYSNFIVFHCYLLANVFHPDTSSVSASITCPSQSLTGLFLGMPGTCGEW